MKNYLGRLLRPVFEHPKMPYYAILLAVLITLPALNATMMMDDYMQRYLVLTDPDANIYEFYRMGAERTEQAIQDGLLPWWLHPDSKLAFYRPVAHWLTQLDYALWPDSLPIMHFHSILWYAVVIFTVGLVYKKLMPAPLAVGLAIVMYVLDYGHGAAVAWLCNRNVLVAMICSMLALYCYMHEQWRWQIVGAAFFALSFACAEAAIAITGYFFAYEVFLSKKPWSNRILRLSLYAAISVVWLIYWRMADYGASGPGFYSDPVSDPYGFLRNLVYRAPVIVVGEFLSLPLEPIGFIGYSPWRWYVLAFILALGALLARLFWPLLKSTPTARFFMLGMLIAALPISGSELVSRSQWYVGFGGIGLIGLYLQYYLNTVEKPARSASVFAVVLLVLHLIISPLISWHGISSINDWSENLDTKKIKLPNDESEPRKFLILSTYMWELGVTLPMIKDMALSIGPGALRPAPSISKVRLLTSVMGEFDLYRKDVNTLVATKEDGFDWIRQGIWGFDPGEVYTLDDMTVRIIEVSDQRAPTVIEFEFAPDELETFDVLAWSTEGYQPAELPAIGETARIVSPPPKLE